MRDVKFVSPLLVAAALCLTVGCGGPWQMLYPAPTVTTAPTLTPAPSPTSTLAPTPENDDEPLPTLSPGNAALPAETPPFADYPTVIQSFLSNGGDPSVLRETLSTWRSINEQGGWVSSDADYTGDGVPEVVVAVSDTTEYQWGGGVYIYTPSGSAYTLLYTDDSTQAGVGDHGHSRPQLISGGVDLNGNGIDDLLYATNACGAHTCVLHVVLLEWDAAGGAFIDLATNLKDEPYSTTSVEDVDGDGIYDIHVDAGMIGSVGAGPQRNFELIYKWDGKLYVPGERIVTTPEEKWHPIHFIMDAGAAMEAGDYAKAVALYQRVIDDPNPEVVAGWPMEQDPIPVLQALARCRIMEAHIWMGNLAAAREDYDALSAQYASNPKAPGGSFFSIADTYWHTYSSTNDKAAACQAVHTYIDANSYEVLYFGYANSQGEPESLCLGGE